VPRNHGYAHNDDGARELLEVKSNTHPLVCKTHKVKPRAGDITRGWCLPGIFLIMW